MLTQEQIEQLTGERLEAVLWASSFLWPDAQEEFEDWLGTYPDVVVPLWKEDPWLAYRVAHVLQVDKEERMKALAA